MSGFSAESNVTSSGGFKPMNVSSSTTESAPVFKFSVTSSDKEMKGFTAPTSSDKKGKFMVVCCLPRSSENKYLVRLSLKNS
jgi:hypothetical protein